MSNREIQYSIIRHLRENTSALAVEWQRDGLSIDNKPKPFIVVWGIQTESDDIAAGRTDYYENYHYQITLRHKTEDELQIFRKEVVDALREPITLYNLSGAPLAAGNSFFVDIEAIVSIPNDDVSREVDNHRLHMDISVETYIDINGEAFTQ